MLKEVQYDINKQNDMIWYGGGLVRNRMLVSLRGGGGELGNLKL
jgi:hypothetical protein